MSFSSDLISRRRFLEFMGRAAATSAVLSPTALLSSCAGFSRRSDPPPFPPLSPTTADQLILADGLRFSVLARFGDRINARGELFGSDNDYLAFLPDAKDPNRGTLWVNHENFSHVLTGRQSPVEKRDRAEVLKEQTFVGGSILRIQRDAQGRWSFDPRDPKNFRLTGATPIPFSRGTVIHGKKQAIGTFANCAGGITPWRTFLTCEENYEHFYGERVFDAEGKPTSKIKHSGYPHGWESVFDRPPEHYGWVVEVNPETGTAIKQIALGRFAHEGATVVLAANQRPVVYMGDDAAGHCLYKFIGDRPGSLERGTLFVANLEQGRWIPLDLELTPALKKRFASQLDVLTYAHEAAILAGGTPLDRPEDIERDPRTGAIYLTLTNNVAKGNFHGSILKVMESDNDPLSKTFVSAVFLSGGRHSGFACPDNLAFDHYGNLWVCTDMSGASMGKPPYDEFGNNGIFYIPMTGIHAGNAFQIASAPVGAEFTGLCFSPDQKTLFVSVQHPGENTSRLEKPTSHWPEGGNALPKSAVVAIQGPTLDSLIQ